MFVNPCGHVCGAGGTAANAKGADGAGRPAGKIPNECGCDAWLLLAQEGGGGGAIPEKLKAGTPDAACCDVVKGGGGPNDGSSGNATGQSRNGTWTLEVNDNATRDTGYIDSWTINF